MADREKSALYPAVTWGECIDFIGKVNSFKAKSISYQELAAKYGLSATTKSFTYRIGSAKQYGLINTTGGNTLQLTERSKQILYPTGESILSLQLECFSTPPLYAKLVARYDNKALPDAKLLANILMNEYGITKSAKDIAAKCFIESANQLNLIKAGVFVFSDAKANAPIEADELQEEYQTPAKSEITDPISASTYTKNESEYYFQSIPFKSGKVAKLSIPCDATEDDLYLLHDLFASILKRRFKIDI